jgi:hypothetical protein
MPLRRLRYEYGAGPVHLLGLLACFAVAAYAVLTYVAGRDPARFALWFVGAIVVHDFILFPLYSALDRLLQVVDRGGLGGAPPVSALNHVRVPVVLSGLLFIVWFPLILGLSERTLRGAAGQLPEPYLERWLLLSGALFAVSALLYAARRARASRVAG